MKTIIRKAYWNFEKEEKWINKMSAKGFAMTDYSWCRYVFSDCEPGEYTYRIELLQKHASAPESRAYIGFMEENGVEHVASYMRWVYFRKKSAEGAFDIYSDIDSRLRHYRGVNMFWSVLAIAELAIGICNMFIGFPILSGTETFNASNAILGAAVTAFGMVILLMCHPIRKKIRGLKTEKSIRE